MDGFPENRPLPSIIHDGQRADTGGVPPAAGRAGGGHTHGQRRRQIAESQRVQRRVCPRHPTELPELVFHVRGLAEQPTARDGLRQRFGHTPRHCLVIGIAGKLPGSTAPSCPPVCRRAWPWERWREHSQHRQTDGGDPHTSTWPSTVGAAPADFAPWVIDPLGPSTRIGLVVKACLVTCRPACVVFHRHSGPSGSAVRISRKLPGAVWPGGQTGWRREGLPRPPHPRDGGKKFGEGSSV